MTTQRNTDTAADEHRPVAFVVDQSFGMLWWNDEGVPGIDLLPSTAEVLDDLARRQVPVWLLADLDEDDCEVLARWVPAAVAVVSLATPPHREHPGPAPDVGAHGRVRTGSGDLAARVARAVTGLGAGGVLVCADRVLRAAACDAGWKAVPAAPLASWVLDGEQVVLAHIEAGEDVVDRLPRLIVAEYEDGGVLGFTTGSTLAAAVLADATVTRLPVDVGRQDPVWVRTAGTEDMSAAVAALASRTVLRARAGTVLVAVDARDHLEDAGLHAAHGHFSLVTANPAGVVGLRAAAAPEAELVAWPWKDRLPILDGVPVLPWRPCRGWAAAFTDDVERYAGRRPLDSAGAITSRHVRHPDNDRAVDALVADLRAIGYRPWVHTFTYGGRTMRNVLADLPGRGLYARADALEHLRRALVDRSVLRKPESIVDRVGDLMAAALDGEVPDGLMSLDGLTLHRELRRAARLHPWLPWWRLRCLLGGLGGRLVIVGCHLDSTASRDGGYDPTTGAAPGADDDASGIAGTLAVARYLWPLRHQLRHRVRLGFFNAEEAGLVGSAAYAAHLAAFGAPVEAVICMDMIGFDSDDHRLFEVHAGAPNAAVRDASEPIAHRIAAWTATLGTLPAPQIYRGTNAGAGADRNVFDGAINRSDHASFQANGYPAVVVTEDFFVNLTSEPGSDPNVSYHRRTDDSVDAGYGSSIACVVAHAVRDIATNGL